MCNGQSIVQPTRHKHSYECRLVFVQYQLVDLHVSEISRTIFIVLSLMYIYSPFKKAYMYRS